jgi:hypothetical protein
VLADEPYDQAEVQDLLTEASAALMEGVMRCLILAACVSFTAGSAIAGDFRTQSGQPMCKTMEDLKTYMIAGLTKDTSAKFNCKFVQPGLRLEVLVSASKNDLLEIVFARVSGKDGKGLVEGFTVNVGLEPY